MNIWIFNHYATNQFLDHGGRHYYFAKYLLRAGYKVTIFCASTVHNTEKNLITDGKLFAEEICDGIQFVFVRTRNYRGNGKSRIINMLDYYKGLFLVTKRLEKPDVIIGSSVHPLACVAAIKLSKKYKCKNVVEIRDLWPESIVAYGIRTRTNPIIKALYWLEKWIYSKADDIIFTMEGGRDYIIEKGWDTEQGGSVDLSKVHHINNGVDLEEFEYNKEHYQIHDPELSEKKIKLIYTGSIRTANHLELLIHAAKQLETRALPVPLSILIYGNGDQIDSLKAYCIKYDVTLVRWKGYIEKKYIPYVLSFADMCYLEGFDTNGILRYGMSPNKLFDYLAAQAPVISTIATPYDIVQNERCGFTTLPSPEALADAIEEMALLCESKKAELQMNSKSAAERYDYKSLAKRLELVLAGKKCEQHEGDRFYGQHL